MLADKVKSMPTRKATPPATPPPIEELLRLAKIADQYQEAVDAKRALTTAMNKVYELAANQNAIDSEMNQPWLDLGKTLEEASTVMAELHERTRLASETVRPHAAMLKEHAQAKYRNRMTKLGIPVHEYMRQLEEKLLAKHPTAQGYSVQGTWDSRLWHTGSRAHYIGLRYYWGSPSYVRVYYGSSFSKDFYICRDKVPFEEIAEAVLTAARAATSVSKHQRGAQLAAPYAGHVPDDAYDDEGDLFCQQSHRPYQGRVLKEVIEDDGPEPSAPVSTTVVRLGPPATRSDERPVENPNAITYS